MQYHEQVVNQTVLNSSFIYNNSFSNAFYQWQPVDSFENKSIEAVKTLRKEADELRRNKPLVNQVNRLIK